jgi:hypothetical protein
LSLSCGVGVYNRLVTIGTLAEGSTSPTVQTLLCYFIHGGGFRGPSPPLPICLHVSPLALRQRARISGWLSEPSLLVRTYCSCSGSKVLQSTLLKGDSCFPRCTHSLPNRVPLGSLISRGLPLSQTGLVPVVRRSHKRLNKFAGSGKSSDAGHYDGLS